MIGKKSFEIDGMDFLRGVTSGANMLDGGLTNESTQMNITAVPGVLYAPGAETDKSTNLTDEMIASCEETVLASGVDRYFCAEDSTLYSYNGTVLTLQETASSDIFQQGVTDMVPFLTDIVLSNKISDTDLSLWDKTTGLLENWWTITLGQTGGTLDLLTTTAWRPLLIYETNLYIGDKNRLHRVDPDLTVSNAILELAATESISALGIDQGSGKMLIATTTGGDFSATQNGTSKIYVYDGFSNKAQRVVPIGTGVVTSFKNVGNTTYIFHGNKLGFWTGSGIEYLRTLNFAKGTSDFLVYPHRATVMDNTLYWVDTSVSPLITNYNSQVMAYGETVEGIKSFYPVVKPNGATGSIGMLCFVSSTVIAYGYSAAKFFIHDITSIAEVINGGASILSKRYRFKRPVTFNGILIEFDQAYPGGNDGVLNLRVIDSHGNTSAANQLSTTRSDVYEWEMTQPTIDTRSIQLLVTIGPAVSTNVIGIRRMTVFYTPKE